MKMKRAGARWFAVMGLVGAVGLGATLGLVGQAGATAARSRRTSSSAVTTVRFNCSVSVTGLTPSAVSVTGSGVADFADQSASLSVDLPAVVTKLIPGGSGSPEVVQAVLADHTVYLDIPGIASEVGAPWISIALPSKATSTAPGIVTRIASALGDVRAIVGFAEAHHATVSPLGRSSVNGVEATGTKIVVTGTSKTGASHTLTATVWADSSDRLIQGDVSTSIATQRGTIGVSATVNLSGYGSPVTITVPPASQVRAIPLSLIESFLGGFKGSHGFGSHGSGTHRSGWSTGL